MDAEKVKIIPRPDIVEDEHLAYLDELRESGVTNMFGAPSYVVDQFGLSTQEAIIVFKYWKATF